MAERLIEKTSNQPDKAQFDAAVREIVLARQKAETANAGLRNAFKRAQNSGFDLKQLKAVLAMRDKDPVELEQEMAVQRRYMILAGLPVGTQMEMFDAEKTGQAATEAALDGLSDEDRHAAAMFDAEQKGYHSGRRAEKLPDCNPYKAGEEAFTEFERGYWRGQEAIALEMRPKDAPKPVKPGRRKKSDNPEDAPAPATDPDGGSVH